MVVELLLIPVAMAVSTILDIWSNDDDDDADDDDHDDQS